MLILSRLCLVISMEYLLLSEGTVTLDALCLDDTSAQMSFPSQYEYL